MLDYKSTWDGKFSDSDKQKKFICDPGGDEVPTDVEFSKSGNHDANMILNLARTFGAGLGTYIEIGCGIGRIMRPLSKIVSQIIGVDVSRKILACAKNYVSSDNALFIESDNNPFLLEMPHVEADVVYSLLAFQHMSEFHSMSYMKRAKSWIKKNGICIFGFPNLKHKSYYEPEINTLNLDSMNAMDDSYVRSYTVDELKFRVNDMLGYQILNITEEDNITIVLKV